MTLSRTAVVLDIDGVVTRGASAVPGAGEALRRLRRQQIPFVFMTNGGGKMGIEMGNRRPSK